ncbi:MAG: hypothetical protein IJP32_02435, partial [Clostridia bacterium]|nr:hypothetical protein [Clostridia bacterium]
MPRRIDNTSLLPPYRPDEEVTLIPSSADGRLMSPDWTDELVLVEVHPELFVQYFFLAGCFQFCFTYTDAELLFAMFAYE